MTVPTELRDMLGMRELVAPLGGDKKEAERKALVVLNRFHAILEEAQEAVAANRPSLSTVAKAHYRAELANDDKGRAVRHPSDQAFFTYSRSVYANKLRLLVADTLDRDEAEALIGFAADDLMSKNLAPDVPRDVLLKTLAQVQLEALARFEERDGGKVILSEPTLPVLTAPDPQPITMAPGDRPSGTTLSDVLTAFHKERGAGGRSLAPKTMEEHKSAVRMFEEFKGGPVAVQAITRKDVIAYKQVLLETPTRYTQRFRGLTLQQAIKANCKRPQPFETLDPQTINMKWLSHLSSILQWAANNGHIEVNPAQGVRVDTGSAKHRGPSRLPFDQADLQRIFGTALFTDPKTYTTKQWALLVALYTGARSSSEIARIKLSDVRDESGILIFDLQEATKNAHSKRLVPVHRDLVKLGLLDYVASLRASGAVRLFPDWQPEDKINRWFLRTYLPSVGIEDGKKVFHSFRHTLKTELIRTGCTKELSDLITGHEDQSVAAVYVHDVPLKRMQAALDCVTFKLPILRSDPS
ncbi:MULTISPECIES: site-specific integrase [Paracoccus]|uniref:site-specific integrase n=1 Tax=Paracoccus TaxID=265 RepID=UPI0023EF7B32|nr:MULTISPECIES: site-specific integrase [Paracoccus]